MDPGAHAASAEVGRGGSALLLACAGVLCWHSVWDTHSVSGTHCSPTRPWVGRGRVELWCVRAIVESEGTSQTTGSSLVLCIRRRSLREEMGFAKGHATSKTCS